MACSAAEHYAVWKLTRELDARAKIIAVIPIIGALIIRIFVDFIAPLMALIYSADVNYKKHYLDIFIRI